MLVRMERDIFGLMEEILVGTGILVLKSDCFALEFG